MMRPNSVSLVCVAPGLELILLPGEYMTAVWEHAYHGTGNVAVAVVCCVTQDPYLSRHSYHAWWRKISYTNCF
jgi:hypothetical protein